MVPVLACLVAMLRTRPHRAGVVVLTGLASGVLGLVSVAVSVLWLQPSWRPEVFTALATTGLVLLALTIRPPAPSARWCRLADLVETVALVALPPAFALAVVTSGVWGR